MHGLCGTRNWPPGAVRMTIVRGVRITSSLLPGRQRSASMMALLEILPEADVFKRDASGDYPPLRAPGTGLDHAIQRILPERRKATTACSSGVRFGEFSPFWVSEGGLEPGNPRVFPGSALEYAGGGEIPCSWISCGHASGRAPAPVKRFVGCGFREQRHRPLSSSGCKVRSGGVLSGPGLAGGVVSAVRVGGDTRPVPACPAARRRLKEAKSPSLGAPADRGWNRVRSRKAGRSARPKPALT